MVKRSYAQANNKNSYKKSRYNGINRAMQSKMLRSLVNKQIVSQQEKKEYQTYRAYTLYGGNGTNNIVINLTGNIAEGTDASMRIGRQIAHHHMTLDYSIAFTPTTTAVMQEWGFVAVVFDRQPNTTVVPNFTTIFDNSSTCPNGMAPRITLDYKDRFTMLYRKPWSTSFAGGSAPVHENVYLDFTKLLKGRDKHATFQTGGSTPDFGAIYLVIASSNASTTASGPTQGVQTQSMVKYVFTDA